MEVLGKMIKTARQERNLTQEQLGQLVGVQKSQISKLESSTNSGRRRASDMAGAGVCSMDECLA
jgi:transcriptional regulator with XRE-family HTH domain